MVSFFSALPLWDSREILDEGTLVHTGVGAEAAKIYKFDGTWYIFLATSMSTGSVTNMMGREDNDYTPRFNVQYRYHLKRSPFGC